MTPTSDAQLGVLGRVVTYVLVVPVGLWVALRALVRLVPPGARWLLGGGRWIGRRCGSVAGVGWRGIVRAWHGVAAVARVVRTTFEPVIARLGSVLRAGRRVAWAIAAIAIRIAVALRAGARAIW